MSNYSRIQSGVREGGQFATGARSDSNVTLAGEHAPVVLADGDQHIMDGDGDVASYFEIVRDEDTYTAYAHVNGGRITELLGAEHGDYEHVERVMNDGARWRAMGDFISSRYPGTEWDDSTDGDDFRLTVARRFDRAPSEVEAVDRLWPTVAQLANETDRGTFGSQYAGDMLSEHLDAQAFLRSDRPNPVTREQALRDAHHGLGGGWISDQTAHRLVEELARDPQAPACYRRLLRRGYASREDLDGAAASARVENMVVADAVADWANNQTPTSELLREKDSSMVA